MTIIFNNPHGAPVHIRKEDAVVVDTNFNGIVYAGTDPATGETMMTTVTSERVLDDPMGAEQYMEDQITSSQLNDMEDAMPNPPKKLFTWKNLRLQSAISGQKAFEAQIPGLTTASTLISPLVDLKNFSLQRISAKHSIRNSPFLLQLTNAEQWYAYLKSLSDSPIDVGAELSMTVSPSQRISVAMFVKEWEQDPGHQTLMRRAAPGADIQEVEAIGNMVYDIITGRGPNPLNAAGYGNFAYDKMFRLAYDMILSLPIRFYNTYTLFQLEADEGGKIYSEVVSNYTPLEVSEVGLVLELRQKLAELGPGYANVVIPDSSLAAEAAALMTKAVSAYSNGDTVTVRSILNYLQEPPFYYMTPSADAKSIFEAKDGTATAVGVNFGDKNKNLPAHNGLVYLKDFKQSYLEESTGKIGTKQGTDMGWKGKSYEVVKSPFDNTVAGVLAFKEKKDQFSYVAGATKSKGGDRAQKRDAAAEIAESLEAASNPRGKPQGRGKFLDLQIHPKTQLKMKLASTSASGTGDKRHGKSPKGPQGGQNKWTMGLYKILNTRIEAMNKKFAKDKKSRKQKYPDIKLMVSGGTLKKTGNWAPYRIKLPKSHFTKKRLPDGTEVIGMKKSLADKELLAAWRKFTDEYGLFKVQRKDNEMYFIPHERGAYYDKVRRQIGATKGTR